MIALRIPVAQMRKAVEGNIILNLASEAPLNDSFHFGNSRGEGVIMLSLGFVKV